MPKCFISIGSNIDKDKNTLISLQELERHFGELTVSSIYETEPVGFIGDSFYNLVVGFNSELSVKEVAKQLRQIELDNGRTRNSQKFSPRTLDLDLILYNDVILNDGRLQIPRDEIERYAFVLEPLAEIAPNLTHPTSHISYAKLWEKFDKTNLKQKRVTPAWTR
ncbi:2-amino-4-hydroxy-6-hydroxymethyldihydropteridine diphosphokinase [Methylobacter sp. S3L5C]|uniref:2-amino-4-hydroxy-6- hydroxymethyldihydropteridine diphosphokinase n=1 Tax=Methylobacter sp. S3L5C TaxID=2839024 RepID=UPI001FAD0F8D|nr:2-amino-4-hydroxy-6-hydroxymethyldihydropteridine diphosphokinase [Methylobacter sp. S3L5C]UOA09091.1 2-amino-4-hydroxy-6-hydroxymethyldihydropteridine diphosphokinase [Methylobacter sp. S3L5C]